MSSKSEIRHIARGKGDTGCANTPPTYPIYLLRKNVTFSESNKFCTDMWSVFLTSKNNFSIISEKGKTINTDDILVFGKCWIIFREENFLMKSRLKRDFLNRLNQFFPTKKMVLYKKLTLAAEKNNK